MDSVYIEYIWYVVSLVMLLAWLGRTRLGRGAFDLAPRRRYEMRITDVLFAGALYIGTTMVAVRVIGQEQNWSWARQDLFGAVLVAGQLVTAGVILLLVSFRYSDGLRGFGIVASEPGKTLGLAFLYSIVIFGFVFFALAVTLYICNLFGYEKIQKHEFLSLLEQSPPPLSMILLIVSPGFVAPLAEELLFRGLLQNFFIGTLLRYNREDREGLGDQEEREGLESVDCQSAFSLPLPLVPAVCRWAGIVMTAALFAMFHADWQHWPALFVLGIGLGYSYERHGNLLIPIVVHSLFNIFSLTVTIVCCQ